MRPIRLEITAFGSYLSTQVLEFEDLHEDGLFLITGPTGAGKSTLLDAMSFALFGKVPGTRGEPNIREEDDVLVKLRPASAPDDLKSEVVFEVAIADRTYRFRRNPEYRKTVSRAKVNHKAMVEELVDGTWVARANGPKEVGALSSEALRMTADQFAQLVLLPQGRFAEFLTANMGKREEILRALFPVSSFVAIREWFKRQRVEAEKSVAELIRSRSNAVVAICAVTGAETDGVPDDVAAWLRDLQAEVAEAHERATDAVRSAQSEFDVANTEFAQAEARSAALTRLNEARTRLARAESALEALTAVVGDAAIAQPYTASLPQVIADLDSAASADAGRLAVVEQAAEAEKVVVEATAELRERQRSLTEAQEIQARHHEALTTLQSELADMGNVEAALAPKRAELDKWSTHARGLAELAESAGAVEEVSAQAADAKKLVAAAEKDYNRVADSMNKSAAADLAELLEDGKPCLVCGSPNHPKPAKAPRTPVEEAELEDVTAAWDEAQERFDALSKDLTTAEAEHKALQKQLTRVKLPMDLDEVQSKVDELTADVTELSSAVERAASLNAKVAAAADKSPALARAVDSAQSAVSQQETVVAVAETNRDNLLAQVPKDIDASALRTRVNAQRQRIADLGEALKKAHAVEAEMTNARAVVEASEEAAAGAVADIAPLQQARDAAQLRLNAAVSQQKKLADQAKELTGYAATLAALAAQASEAEANVSRWKKIAEYIEGTAGRRIPLERFYLGYRLKQVAAAASIRLLAMSSQQFAFEHSDDMKAAHGAQGGLALAIRDLANDDLRDPGSLSGGETFMASLALALGLSDVVSAEAGGQRLDSLFIDEGFGTLDTDGTLDEVMSIFDGLRSHGRLVGIISHVASLKERVPTQVKVAKTKDGSQIRVVTDGS